ncbi:MAG: MATE family efflux transporter [Bacteroidetes bacterium]|nr:MATE family efflux transporter [Bacteroidota bacterium]MCY4225887.1 MATE family efflux transporter [Bacteroidota bacterium]
MILNQLKWGDSSASKVHLFRSEARNVTALSIPIVATQLGQISNGFIDVMMVGRLGPPELAGVALGNATYFLFALIGIGVLLAVGPLVSQAYGAKQHDPIGRTVRQAIWLATLLSLPVLLIMWNARIPWTVMQQDPSTIAYAEGYLRAAMWGFLPFMWFNGLRNFVEAIGRPLPVTIIIVAGILLNIFANYALMFGHFGFPRLGLIGTGWSTSIVHWFMFAAIASYVSTQTPYRSYGVLRKLRTPDLSYFRELLRVGLPIGGSIGLEVTLFSATAFLIGTFGAVPIAAHQIAIQCAAITYMVPLGIGLATSVRVGQNIGAKDPTAAALSGYTGIGLAFLFMTCTALLFLFAPTWITSIYIDIHDPENVDTALQVISLLGIAAIFQLFDGVQATALGALRGLKDTKFPMILGFIAYWLIGMPTGLGLGFGLQWGPEGFWWGLVVGLFAASILFCMRFYRMTNRHSAVVPSFKQYSNDR